MDNLLINISTKLTRQILQQNFSLYNFKKIRHHFPNNPDSNPIKIEVRLIIPSIPHSFLNLGFETNPFF